MGRKHCRKLGIKKVCLMCGEEFEDKSINQNTKFCIQCSKGHNLSFRANPELEIKLEDYCTSFNLTRSDGLRKIVTKCLEDWS